MQLFCQGQKTKKVDMFEIDCLRNQENIDRRRLTLLILNFDKVEKYNTVCLDSGANFSWFFFTTVKTNVKTTIVQVVKRHPPKPRSRKKDDTT